MGGGEFLWNEYTAEEEQSSHWSKHNKESQGYE